MKLVKRTVKLFIFLLAAFVLTACSGDGGAKSGDKIQFFVSGDSVEGGALKKMSEKYTEETGVEVEVVDVPYEDMVTRITNMIQAGDSPALARVTGFNPVWKDSLMDLSQVAEKNQLREDLLIADGDEVKAIPLDLTAVGLFINKDLFDQAGVAYPVTEDDIWSWDGFVSGLEKVVENSDAKYGMVMDQSEHRLMTMLYQFGSKGFYEKNGIYTTNQETKEGLEYFVNLNDDKIMPKTVWTTGEDPAAMFKSGQIAAYFSGSWQIKDFEQNIKNFEWKSVYMPYQKVRSTNLGGNYIIAFEGSGVEEETKKFIDWLYTKENYEELCGLGGYMPVMEEAEVDYGVSNDSYEVYNNEISSSDPIAAVLRTERDELQLLSERSAANALRDEVVKLLNGEQDIDETIENAAKIYTEAYGNS